MSLIKWTGVLALACAGCLSATSARAADISCKMSFQLSGWSLFYKTAAAQVLTKGNVSLALSGKGEGWNLGVAFGAFIIE